ncbi:hypothetical protein AB0B25_30870 [Nocardia sp. NPDC049190]|uniref:hypothetical protein n=1 Tax=Nocardia sp. NPDC049190 TaxID=3155650 RepID=UPI0033E78751
MSKDKIYSEILLDVKEIEPGSPALQFCAENYVAEHYAIFPRLIAFPGLLLRGEIRRLRREGVRKNFSWTAWRTRRVA